MGKYKQLSVLTLKLYGGSRDENVVNQGRRSSPHQLSSQRWPHSPHTPIKVRIATGKGGILCTGLEMYVKALRACQASKIWMSLSLKIASLAAGGSSLPLANGNRCPSERTLLVVVVPHL